MSTPNPAGFLMDRVASDSVSGANPNMNDFRARVNDCKSFLSVALVFG